MRTIELAERARGRTSPNPLVGAVVVKEGRVIGEGWHEAAGLPHAEREALAACSEDPAGRDDVRVARAVLPHGRTPPCTDAIVEARIARVVVASDDPSEHASGRGLGILRDEGIRVDMAAGAPAACRPPAQPAVPQARQDRPSARALQVRDDARRQGRHLHRRLAVDLRRAEPRDVAPLARRGGRRGRGHRHRTGRRPSAHRPHRGRRAPAGAGGVRLRGAPARLQPARAHGERGAASSSSARAAPRAPTRMRSRPPAWT